MIETAYAYATVVSMSLCLRFLLSSPDGNAPTGFYLLMIII